MTNDLSVEHEVSKTSQTQTQTKTATLELLEQSGLNVHWDRVIAAVYEGEPNIDPWAVADISLRLRSQRLFTFAMWLGEEVVGYVLFEPVILGEERAINVRALSGHDITLDQWKTFIAQAQLLFRVSGYRRMVCLTSNPRVLEIIEADGWKLSTYGERVL